MPSREPLEEITEISEDMIQELSPEELFPILRPRRSPPPLPSALATVRS